VKAVEAQNIIVKGSICLELVRKSKPIWKFRGLGKERVDNCGCRIIAYPGGKTIRTGCSLHPLSRTYACQVCGTELETNDDLHEHRWTHAVG
jgi:hypothetical protein